MDKLLPSPFGLIPYYAGSERCRPLHAWTGMRDHWLFHLVHRGSGSVRLGGPPRILGAGEGFLVGPDTEVHYRADGQAPWTYSWLACAGPVAAECFAACGLGPDNWLYGSADPGFHGEGGAFMQTISGLSACQSQLGKVAWLFRAFAGLQSAARPNARVPATGLKRRPVDAYWEAVQDFVRTTYSRDDARIEHLAERIGVSRKYLSEIIRERCGKSPRALLSSFRLERACDLLAGTSLSVGAIAASVGFGDQLGFSKAFRHAWGMSPSEWRKTRHAAD